MADQFAELTAATAVPGNLPVPPTSLIGREVPVAELVAMMGSHRLVTLTGVGGVGKTRLAIQVATELMAEFSDGVWFVELAPVSDPAAVPDVVATVLGVNAQAGSSTTETLAGALSGRRVLIVLDNCEHVLDAAADLVEAILARSETVSVLATSREGLRADAEQLWSVPSLDVRDGAASTAVGLFVDRARAVNVDFDLDEAGVVEAVVEICERLDGIALGIELAAARMVSMSAQDIRDRLGDRFRLLAGGRRGLERHQTLRHAVGWSFDLLDDDEKAVLCRSAVFADGFDLAAIAHLCEEAGLDDYAVLDLLDALVRKSLVTVDRAGGHARYDMLETIRQYAVEQLVAAGDIAAIRDRHARYFADQAQTYWAIWHGPDEPLALDWVTAEFANLRAGFGWAVDRGDLACAAAIAAHTVMMTWVQQQFEAVDWCQQILEAATAADIAQLPRLYTAASVCSMIGQADEGLEYINFAIAMEVDERYDPFDHAWSVMWHAAGTLYAGDADRALEIFVEAATHTGLEHLIGLTHSLTVAVAASNAAYAMAHADAAIAAARSHGSPSTIAQVLYGTGRAFHQTDPDRAAHALREGLVYARRHGLTMYESLMAREAAGLEAVHGDMEEALDLFDSTIDSQFRAGSVAHLVASFANLAVLFDRYERPEIAAMIYGASTRDPANAVVINLAATLDHLRSVLGDREFDDRIATGAAMDTAAAVQYARDQIALASSQLPASP